MMCTRDGLDASVGREEQSCTWSLRDAYDHMIRYRYIAALQLITDNHSV